MSSWFHSKNIGNRRDVLKELLILDELCIKQDIHTEFIIVGGAMLIMILEESGTSYRMTSDIDIYRLKTDKTESLNIVLNNILRERINTRVESVLIPDGEELVKENEIKPFHHDLFTNIKPYVPSPEMLVVMKSISDRRVDMDDLLNSGILEIVNAEKTIDLIMEYKSFSPFSNLPDNHWNIIVNELKNKL